MDPLTTPEFRLQPRDLRALAAFDARSSTPTARLLRQLGKWLIYAAYGVGAAAGVVLVAQGRADIISYVWLILVARYAYPWVKARLPKKKPDGTVQMAQTVTIGPGGLQQKTNLTVSFVRWRVVSLVGRDRVSTYIVVRSAVAYVVPHCCFANRTDADAFYRSAMAFHDAARDKAAVPAAIKSWTEDRPADLTYTLTQADLKPIERHLVDSRRNLSPWRLGCNAVYFGALTLLFAGLAFLDISVRNFAGLPRDLIIVYTGVTCYNFLVARRSAMHVTRSFLDIPWEMRVFPAHFVLHGPSEQYWVSWLKVKSIDNDDNVVYLNDASGGWRPIPRRSFAAQAEAQMFVDMMRRYHAETWADLRSRSAGDAGTDAGEGEVWPPAPRRPG